MLTPEDRKARIEAMRTVADRMAAQIDGLTDEQLTTAYMPGEWTIAQNVHHLADAQLNAYFRFKLVLYDDNPPIKAWEQDDWAKAPDAQIADVSHSLAMLRAIHTRWIMQMEALNEADWSRTGIHELTGKLTLASLLDYYGQHGDVHIKQIAQVMGAMP